MADHLSYAEAADLTGLPLGTLYALVAQKRIPHVRLGPRLVRFPRAKLDAWLRQHFVDAKESTR